MCECKSLFKVFEIMLNLCAGSPQQCLHQKEKEREGGGSGIMFQGSKACLDDTGRLDKMEGAEPDVDLTIMLFGSSHC